MLLSSAQAAGLGKLTVLSALGQPLRAEIELNSVSKDETGALVAKLASQDAFRKANVDFNPVLMSLRFAVEQRGSRQFIKVSSSQSINDPFVDLLLELSANNNRMVREYTFLLDPAELRAGQPAQVAAPVNVTPAVTAPAPRPVVSTAPSEAPVATTPVPTGNTRQAMRAAVKASGETKAAASSGSDYQVKRGDTLAGIANQFKPEGVSLDQMLVGLYRANPNAFVGNNMNRLRSDQILSVPDAETSARGIGAAEAKGVVVAQAADFNEYRNKLAGQVAAMAPNKSEEAKQSASGKIGATVEERATAANEAKDKLKLSKAGAAPGAPDKATGAAASAEDKIAKERAVADANTRVKELEKNVNDLQKLLEVKDQNLATQQKAGRCCNDAQREVCS
ncbi:FimV family protein [Undibacterium arcticum]